MGVVFRFGTQDVAFDALAETVHAAFLLRLAGGEGGGGGAAGEGFGSDDWYGAAVVGEFCGGDRVGVVSLRVEVEGCAFEGGG